MSELKDAALGAHFIEEFKRALLLEGGYVTSLTAEVVNHPIQKDAEKKDRDTKSLTQRIRRRTSAARA